LTRHYVRGYITDELFNEVFMNNKSIIAELEKQKKELKGKYEQEVMALDLVINQYIQKISQESFLKSISPNGDYDTNW